MTSKEVLVFCLLAFASVGFCDIISRCSRVEITGVASAGTTYLDTVTVDVTFSSARPYSSNFRVNDISSANKNPDIAILLNGIFCNSAGCSGTLQNTGYNVYAVLGGINYTIGYFNLYRGIVYPASGYELSIDEPLAASNGSTLKCIEWTRVFFQPSSSPCVKFFGTSIASNGTDELAVIETEININKSSVTIQVQSVSTAVQQAYEATSLLLNNKTIGTNLSAVFYYDASRAVITKLDVGLYTQWYSNLNSFSVILPHGFFEIRDGNTITFSGSQFTGTSQCITEITPVSALSNVNPSVTTVYTEFCCEAWGWPTTTPPPPLTTTEAETTTEEATTPEPTTPISQLSTTQSTKEGFITSPTSSTTESTTDSTNTWATTSEY